MFKFSKKSEKRMEGIHPDLKLILCESIKVSPIDFGIPKDGGVRTAERQMEMYLDSSIKTNCDGINDLSNHQIQPGEQFGMAFDFYAYLNGRPSWGKHHLAMVAGTIMSTANRLLQQGLISIELVWGGTFGSNSFNGWDACHMEVKR